MLFRNVKDMSMMKMSLKHGIVEMQYVLTQILLTWKAVNLKGLSGWKIPSSLSHLSGLNSSASSPHMNFILPIAYGW